MAKAKTKAQKTANKAQAAFTSVKNDYMNPSQFFNFASSAQNFKPANVQQFMEQWIATSQKNMEAMTACAQMAAEYTKESMEEAANFSSKLIQEASSTLQETFANTGDPKDKLEEIADCAKYCMEKTATFARKAAEENMQTAQKIGNTLSKRIAEATDEIKNSAAA
jgi:hypothetical protein